jgi:hypothetical protein
MPDSGTQPHLPRAWPLLLFVGFAVLNLTVLRGALHGPFLSDDGGYIVSNTYLRELSMENLAAFFDPRSPAQIHAVGNYSPVHLLLHALEWQIFADRVFGYHLVNVLLHALVSVLLTALLLASRAPPLAALLGATLFAVHPANVEAVAWISQLKTTAGLAFALGALLALGRWPALAAALFGLGLLTKAAVAFALPTAAAFLWVRRGSRRQWAWLGVWMLLLAAYLLLEFVEFRRWGWIEVAAYQDPLVHLRSIAAYGVRYLVMAATSYGVSAYHEPEPVFASLDPWWLAALPAAVVLGWRCVVTLARRDEEGAWWISAAAAYAPVSQVFPFMHPMADHYLYFILPGLIGGSILLAARLRGRVPAGVRPAAIAAALALVLVFGWQSQARAKLWRNDVFLALEATRNYPQGRTARLFRAQSAARSGDVTTAVAELRGAYERGLYEFRLLDDPSFAPIRDEPEFRELVREWAGRWIESARARGASTQSEWRIIGMAHLRRDELEQAVAAYEHALALGGAEDDDTRRKLRALRALRERRHGGADPS